MAVIASPLMGVLDSILAWQRAPGQAGQQRIGGALGRLAAAEGVLGVFLDAAPAAFPGLSTGWGSLEAASGPIAPSARTGRMELHLDGLPLGAIWFEPAEPRPIGLTDAVELALAVAWSRAEAQNTAERLEALDAAIRGITGIHALDRVLQLIVDRVRDLIAAEYAALGINNEHGVIERFVTSGISRAQREAIGALPQGRGLLGLIIAEDRTYRIPEIEGHPASHGFPPGHPPMRSFLGVPVRVKGRSVGNFYLTNKKSAVEFSESDQNLVEMFALHAGIAIENARLHEQVQRLAVVDERVRIGKDLHDGIIQGLYAISLSLEDVGDLMRSEPDEAAQRVDRAIDAMNLTIRDIRNFIFGLRPELAEQAGVVAGLAALANEFRLNSVIDVELDAPDDVPDVDPHTRAELLKIAREALSNVARHSKATRVLVRIQPAEDALCVSISDNGGGFAINEQRGREHQGLANMRTRATDLNGTLAIESSSAGTRITVVVPAHAGAGSPYAGRGGDL
jgi:signal transduction histidine kinase